MSQVLYFIPIAGKLELAGLHWQPEIGDEICSRTQPEQISILVDPNGMTPNTLRQTYIWLPSVEQLVQQVEARKAILFHAGLELSKTSVFYKTVIQCSAKQFESTGESLRSSVGKALVELIVYTDGSKMVLN